MNDNFIRWMDTWGVAALVVIALVCGTSILIVALSWLF